MSYTPHYACYQSVDVLGGDDNEDEPIRQQTEQQKNEAAIKSFLLDVSDHKITSLPAASSSDSHKGVCEVTKSTIPPENNAIGQHVIIESVVHLEVDADRQKVFMRTSSHDVGT